MRPLFCILRPIFLPVGNTVNKNLFYYATSAFLFCSAGTSASSFLKRMFFLKNPLLFLELNIFRKPEMNIYLVSEATENMSQKDNLTRFLCPFWFDLIGQLYF
jgi:hypothetical protein